MTRDDILHTLEELLAGYPARTEGEVIEAELSQRFGPLVRSARAATVAALKTLIAARPTPPGSDRLDEPLANLRMWVALRIGDDYRLEELRPDVNALLEDIEESRVFLPYYADILRGRTRHIPGAPDAGSE